MTQTSTFEPPPKAGQLHNDIAPLVTEAGTPIAEKWAEEQLHELKHQGPKKVLEEVNRLLQNHPPGADTYFDSFCSHIRFLDRSNGQ